MKFKDLIGKKVLMFGRRKTITYLVEWEILAVSKKAVKVKYGGGGTGWEEIETDYEGNEVTNDYSVYEVLTPDRGRREGNDYSRQTCK